MASIRSIETALILVLLYAEMQRWWEGDRFRQRAPTETDRVEVGQRPIIHGQFLKQSILKRSFYFLHYRVNRVVPDNSISP